MNFSTPLSFYHKILALACAGLALCTSNALAWGDAGHMTVAAEAYRQLSPELKAQAFEVLKSHPDFAKWSKAYHPNPVIDLPAYVFIRSSTWPDEIRRTDNQYDHPNWHFIDYPLRPPAFAMEPDDKPGDNILFGIDQCEKTLSDTNAGVELRAAYLSYLIHLIGDIHQPLHCSSFYTEIYTNGDRGGNDFYVKPAQQAIRLHGLWDGLPGGAASAQAEWKNAILLESKFPRASLPELTKAVTPVSWSLASRQLSIDKGYLRGTLPGSAGTNDVPPLPESYTQAAKIVADRQVALAGYRLADDIVKNLKLGREVALLPPNTNTAMVNLPKEISVFAATNYYDQEMVVTGKVVQVNGRSSITFINLDVAGPQSPFTAVIFQSNLGAFGDLNRFTNRVVAISGTIVEYHNRPEIVLETPEQLKIIPQK